MKGANVASYNTNKVLPQYDEEDEEVINKKRNRIMLAAENETAKTKAEKLEELREKLSLKSKTKVSLDVSKVIVHSPLMLIEHRI